MKNKLLIAAGMFLALSASVVSANNTPFTFNVPVNLSNMPDDATHFMIVCATFPATGSMSNANQISNKQTSWIAIQNNAVGDVVSVPTRLRDGKNPINAKRYKCELKLKGAGGSCDPSNANTYADKPWCQADPDATKVVKINGQL